MESILNGMDSLAEISGSVFSELNFEECTGCGFEGRRKRRYSRRR